MRKLFTLLSISLVVQTLLPPSSKAQHNWNDLQARERSQRLNSRALNFLNKGPQSKGAKTALDQAVSTLIEATHADPTDPVPFQNLGLAQVLKHNYQDALNALSTAYKLSPHGVETLLSIGFAQYASHSFQRAFADFGKILQLDPKMTSANTSLGFCLLRMGQLEKSKVCFQRTIKLDPTSAVSFQGLAIADYLNGDLDSAMHEAEQAESIRHYVPVARLLAEIYFLRGDDAKATALLRQMEKSKPPFQQRSMTQIGYSSQHDFHWDPYLVDDFDTAAAVRSRWLALPKEAGKQKSLTSSGKLEAKLAAAQEDLSGAPQDYYLLRQMALLNLAIGNYDDAITQFNLATTACPECHVDYLYLGRALSLNGKQAEAAQFVGEFSKHFASQAISPQLTAIIKASQEQKAAAPTGPAANTTPPSVVPAANPQTTGQPINSGF